MYIEVRGYGVYYDMTFDEIWSVLSSELFYVYFFVNVLLVCLFIRSRKGQRLENLIYNLSYLS